ncbi:hypothetical protein H6G76_34055 [Nostoc sp. FACHB-152]|uniref:hypothetical protein n=1 Tax=unclassified Nostoc TaxID=2593658 RepID=UPI0016837C26|nr:MULTISPECIES: hypothetical protein [unclassified Nostoc]MBD2452051.1 hypothetical protein [Nostoc sp. FACHB-152]MBD2468405.1 hypothetical protein [Nostoc sp. FACHB-145]
MTQKLQYKRYMTRLALFAAVGCQLQQSVILAGINMGLPSSQILSQPARLFIRLTLSV